MNGIEDLTDFNYLISNSQWHFENTINEAPLNFPAAKHMIRMDEMCLQLTTFLLRIWIRKVFWWALIMNLNLVPEMVRGGSLAMNTHLTSIQCLQNDIRSSIRLILHQNSTPFHIWLTFFWVKDIFATGFLGSQMYIDITSLQNHLLTEGSLDDKRKGSWI